MLAEQAAAGVDLRRFRLGDGRFRPARSGLPACSPIVARIAAGRPADRALDPVSDGDHDRRGRPQRRRHGRPDRECRGARRLRVVPEVQVGANVRDRGGDLVTGDPVVPAGVRLGAVHLGALAAAGVTTCAAPGGRGSYWPSPAASSGRPASRFAWRDLRRERSHPRDPDRQYRGNRRAPASSQGRCKRHRAAIERGLEADVLLTSGGVSVGVYDFVRSHRARARGRGGLLAGRGPSRQAGRLRCRAVAPSCSACRGTRSPRSSASSSSSALLCWRSRGPRRRGRVPAGPAWPCGRLSGSATRCSAPAPRSRTARSCSTR